MVKSTSVAVSVFLFMMSSCTASVGVSGVKVPPDSAQQCQAHCESIGMKLSAVAIMANTVGCVCELPKGQQADAVSSEASATAGGMTAILMQQAQQERQQQDAATHTYSTY